MIEQPIKSDYGTVDRRRLIQQLHQQTGTQGMCDLCGEWDSALQEGACDYCNKTHNLVPERAA